jgi:hypothetical protein
MKILIFGILMCAQLGVVVYFIIRIVKQFNSKKNVANPASKALMQFFIMVGILAAISILQFSVAYFLPSPN